MTKPHKIERLYAWIATDGTGEDGVPAVDSLRGPLPMVGADKARIESFRPQAAALGQQGYAVRLVEFTGMVTLEAFAPAPGARPAKHR